MHFISGWGRGEMSNFRHSNVLVVPLRWETDVTKWRVGAGLNTLNPDAKVHGPIPGQFTCPSLKHLLIRPQRIEGNRMIPHLKNRW